MKQGGIKMKYVLPALVLLMLCSAVLLVGNARARTQNGVFWSGQLDLQQTEITGEYLFAGGQRILMDPMDVDVSRQIPITIEAESGGTNGILSCSVRYEDKYGVALSPAQAYMEASLSTLSVYVQQYYPQTVTLTLIPTDYAREARGYEVKAITTVNWADSSGDVLSADFITTLPVVEPEDVVDPSEPGESEPTSSDTSASTQPGESSEPASESTAAPTEASPAPTETTAAPTETTAAPTETTAAPTEAPEVPDQPSEEAGESQQSAGQSDPAADGAQSQTTDQSGEAPDETTQNTQPPTPTAPPEITVTAAQSFSVSHMTAFDPEGDLAIIITLPTGSTGATLTMAGADFPAMTRYRIGNSGKPTLLLDGGPIELTGRADGVYTLLLDLSATAIAWYSDETVPESGETARTYRDLSVTVTSRTTGEIATVTASPSLTAALRPEVAPVLHGAGSYAWAQAPDPWGDCSLACTFYRLETDESGTISYKEIPDPSAEGLEIVKYSDTISIKTGSSGPLPGTYRLTLTWSYQGLIIHQVNYPFFVNQSGYALYTTTGGA